MKLFSTTDKQVPRDGDGKVPVERYHKSIGKRQSIFLCMEVEIDKDGKPIDTDISTELLGVFSKSPSESFEDASGVKYSVKKAKIQDVQEIITEKDREVRLQKGLTGAYKTENTRFITETATHRFEMQSLVASDATKTASLAAQMKENATRTIGAFKQHYRQNAEIASGRILDLDHRLRCSGMKVPRTHPWDDNLQQMGNRP